MRRVVVVVALLALALPMAARASSVTILNKNGTLLISGMAGTGGMGTIGVSTLSLMGSGSLMTGFGSFAGVLGRVEFSTGALLSGSVSGGGVFSAAGSIFDIMGNGNKWMKGLVPPVSGKATLFSGVFDGPIDWTLTSHVGNTETFTLSGEVTGMLYDGKTFTGFTTQNFTDTNGKLLLGKAHLTTGTTQISNAAEPGTLALLGTGLLGIAGVFRRKLLQR